MSLAGGAGTASLLGLGQRPNCSSSSQLKRKIQAEQPWSQAAKRPCAVTLRVRRRAPKPLFPTTVLCRAKWARPPPVCRQSKSHVYSPKSLIPHCELSRRCPMPTKHFLPPAAPSLRAADGSAVPRRPPWRAGFRPRAAQRGGAAVMRPNRADSALSQYFCSLPDRRAAARFAAVRTDFLRHHAHVCRVCPVIQRKRKSAQNRVERRADSGGFCPLRRCACPLSGACAAYQAELAVYWHDFFRTDAEELPAAPAPLDEREMVALVMADEGFQARVDADFRRATARDEVVYPSRSLSSDIPSPSGRA